MRHGSFKSEGNNSTQNKKGHKKIVNTQYDLLKGEFNDKKLSMNVGENVVRNQQGLRYKKLINETSKEKINRSEKDKALRSSLVQTEENPNSKEAKRMSKKMSEISLERFLTNRVKN